MLVLVAHAVALIGRDLPVVPLTSEDIGGLGVQIFFAISGLLVARSWLNEPRVGAYLMKRALRILPGLVVVVVLTAYVLGPAVTTADRLDYLTSKAPASYVLGNTLMLHEDAVSGHVKEVLPAAASPGTLPGVFEDNPYHVALVNGPLWTLPLEVTAYVLLLLAGLMALRRAWHVRVVLAALVVAGIVLAVKAAPEAAYPLFAAFAGGALLYTVRARLPLDGWIFAASVVGWIAAYQLPLGPRLIVIALTAAYAVTFLGLRGIDRLRALTRPGDVSYGLYIYHWPVSQTIVLATGTRSAAVSICLSLVVTYALALASWRLVERPALRLKARLSHSSVRRITARSSWTGVRRVDREGRPVRDAVPGQAA